VLYVGVVQRARRKRAW